MTLDGRYPELDLFLHRVRRGLNLRFLAGEALVAAAVAAPAALVPAFLFPVAPPPTVVWVGSTAAALGWAVWKFHLRLTLGQAATWLDEAQGTKGLFRSASDALDRDPLVFPDEVNLKAADLERMVVRRARYPWRRLGLRLGLATGSVLAAFLVASLPLSFGWSSRVGTPDSQAGGRPEAPASVEGGKGQAVGPQEAAKRLFPENQRLAALAEQALASGDVGALQSLMDQNPGQASVAEREKLARRPGQGGPSLAGPRGPGGDPGTGGTGDRGTEGAKGAPGTSSGSKDNPGTMGGPGRESPSKGSSGTKDQDPSSAEGTTPGTGTPGDPADAANGKDGGNNPQPHGVTPGTNHSEEKLGARGPLPGGARRVVVPEKAQPGVFEYLLPETGARVPLAQALADTSRTAEAALDRSSAPMEYENTVREYFLTLSQEAKP